MNKESLRAFAKTADTLGYTSFIKDKERERVINIIMDTLKNCRNVGCGYKKWPKYLERKDKCMQCKRAIEILEKVKHESTETPTS